MEDREILEGLKSGRAYDFIANNYWRMSNGQLKDIILELLAQFDGLEYQRIVKELTVALVDYKAWEE